MRTPTRIDLLGDRGVAFNETITVIGYDWTSATFRMQVRQTPDMVGTAIAALTTGAGVFLDYAGTALVSAHIAAGRLTNDILNYVNPVTNVKYTTGDSVTLSIVRMGIAAISMSAPNVPYAAERGDDVVLYWDMLVDPDGGGAGFEDKWFYGTFTVRATVTV